MRRGKAPTFRLLDHDQTEHVPSLLGPVTREYAALCKPRGGSALICGDTAASARRIDDEPAHPCGVRVRDVDREVRGAHNLIVRFCDRDSSG